MRREEAERGKLRQKVLQALELLKAKSDSDEREKGLIQIIRHLMEGGKGQTAVLCEIIPRLIRNFMKDHNHRIQIIVLEALERAAKMDTTLVPLALETILDWGARGGAAGSLKRRVLQSLAALYPYGLRAFASSQEGGTATDGDKKKHMERKEQLRLSIKGARERLLAALAALGKKKGEGQEDGKAPQADNDDDHELTRAILLRFVEMEVLLAAEGNKRAENAPFHISLLDDDDDDETEALVEELRRNGEAALVMLERLAISGKLSAQSLNGVVAALGHIATTCRVYTTRMVNSLTLVLEKNTKMLSKAFHHERRLASILRGTMRSLLSLNSKEAWVEKARAFLSSDAIVPSRVGSKRPRDTASKASAAGGGSGSISRRRKKMKQLIDVKSKKFKLLVAHPKFKSISRELRADIVLQSLDNYPETSDTISSVFKQLIKRLAKSAVSEEASDDFAALSAGGQNVAIKVRALGAMQKVSLGFKALRRIWSSQTERTLAGPNERRLRDSLISKIATQVLAHPHTEADMSKFILSKWDANAPLALLWLCTIVASEQRGGGSATEGRRRPTRGRRRRRERMKMMQPEAVIIACFRCCCKEWKLIRKLTSSWQALSLGFRKYSPQ